MTPLQGKEIDYSIETPEKQPAAETGSASYNIEAQAAQEIKFAYCTQFLIMLEKPISTKTGDGVQRVLRVHR